MKNKLFLFIILNLILLNKKESDFEKFYVFNFYGTELKEKPNINSKTLQKLKLGDSLYLIKNTEIDAKKSVLKDKLYLNGKWSQVKYKNKTGYVFNGDYSKLKIKTKKNDSNYILIDYGKPNSKTKSIENFTFKNKPFKQFILKEEYDFFTEITTTSNFDAGESLEIISTKLNINEMIQFMYLILKTSTQNQKGETIGYFHPYYLGFSNGVYSFDGPGSYQDIKINQLKDTVFFSCNM